MIFLHVHSQQIYSFFRHLSATSVPRIITGVLICGMMAGCAANREKEDEVKYDMLENLPARFNTVYHGRKIIADVKRQHFDAHPNKYQPLLQVLIETTEARAMTHIKPMN